MPAVDNNGVVTDFTDASVTDSLSLKEILAGQTCDNNTRGVEIMVPLKHLSNFWKTIGMPLIDYEITLDINWSESWVIEATNVAAQATTFSITDTKFHVTVLILSTQDNAELLEQLKSGFKRTIN